VMDEILRQRDPELKAAVEASLAGEIGRAFESYSQKLCMRRIEEGGASC